MNLRDTIEALDLAKNPYTPLDLAEADSSVADARVSLKEAQDRLARMLEPTAKDIAEAESRAATAGTSLETAQDTLTRLLQPTARDIARAESDVVAARIAVENASAALAELQAGPDQDEIAQAQSQVNAAETTLANAQRDLTLTRKQWDDSLQAAQESYDSDLADYQGVIQKWLGGEMDEAEANLETDALLDSWGVDLTSLFDPALRFGDVTKGLFAEGPPSNDATTRWNEVTVYIWTNMFPGPIAATCEDGVVPSEGACIQKEIDDAWAAYDQSGDSLDTVQIQAAKAVATAEGLVTRSEESLAATQSAWPRRRRRSRRWRPPRRGVRPPRRRP